MEGWSSATSTHQTRGTGHRIARPGSDHLTESGEGFFREVGLLKVIPQNPSHHHTGSYHLKCESPGKTETRHPIEKRDYPEEDCQVEVQEIRVTGPFTD
jgi:hypothetical protein